MEDLSRHSLILADFLGLDCTTTKPSIGILSTTATTSPTTGLLFEQVSASFFSRDKTLALPEEQVQLSNNYLSSIL
jgi:hypothetical protein